MNNQIGKQIAKYRKHLGITQEKLGELIGVSGQAVSKWENAESLPDIVLVPRLCEILGTTADNLLGVSKEVKHQSCMENVFDYSKINGEYHTAYQAICATSYISDRKNGCAKMSADGIKIHTTKGFGFVISNAEMLQIIKKTDFQSIKAMTELIINENIMAVVRVLKFADYFDEAEIAEKTGLSVEIVEKSLFKLIKSGICERDVNGKYAFGAKSYILFAILMGFYLSTPDGYMDIGNSTHG